MPANKKGLGKGLDALFSDNEINVGTAGGFRLIRISDIEPNKNQPRKTFAQEPLQNLADSIKLHGVLSPLLVAAKPGGRYEIIAGERRWRASRLAGLTELPCIVMELSDSRTMEISLIENLQREDLNPIEEALGYKALIDEFELTQEQIASRVGKSRPAVANALRLLSLPDGILQLVKNGDLPAGHAKAILSCKDEKDMQKLADLIVANGMTVRRAEQLAKKMSVPPKTAAKQLQFDYLEAFEKSLSEQLSRRVKINSSGKRGKVEIEYYGNDDLEALLKTLGLQVEE